MKKLLLRCDDFGSAAGANQAILRLAESGLTFNVSVMICGPEGKKNLEVLARHAPHLGLGIHAAVNAEWDTVKWGPVGDTTQARAHGLVDAQGHFHADPNKLSQVPPEIVLDEVRAQIRRGLGWGIPFSYLDEHMGFSWVQNLRAPLAALAEEFGLIYRPAIPGLQPGKTYGGLVANWREGLKSIHAHPHLLITHPALDDDSTRPFYNMSILPGVVPRERQAEFEALGSLAWREALSAEKIELITYQELTEEEVAAHG